jgi:hypothetical protein
MPRRDPKLLRAAKNSPWILIAIGLHVILATALSVVVIQHGRRAAIPNATSIAVAPPRSAAPEPLVPEPRLDRAQIPETERTELVSYEEALEFVPTEDAKEPDWYADLADPSGSEGDDDSASGGTSIGVGIGGHHGTGVPSGILGTRVGPGGGRGKGPGRTTRGGPPAGTEEAVLEGLRWLMRHQNEDGSWSAASLHTHCSTVPPCIAPDPSLDTSYDAGMTALALLAFLGEGISIGSRLEIVDTAMGRPPRPAGEIVKRGIRWLLERQRSDGSFSDSQAFALPENDTLPTMALCEAYALARGSTKLRQAAQRALDFLVAAQRRTAEGELSGWGIGSENELEARHARGELADADFEEARSRADLSISCWVVMALKSAQTCGFRVPDEALAGALAYAAEASASAPAAGPAPDPEDAFTYHPSRKAALGILVRAFAGGDVMDPFLEGAARELAGDLPCVTKDRSSVDFYYWYFATLALEQYDGPRSPRERRGAYWEPWNASLVAAMLPLQDRSKKRDVCSRGGWLQEARGNRRGRALYNTALNVLTLEVYYRFENVFGLAK